MAGRLAEESIYHQRAGRRQAWFEVDGSTGSDSWGRHTIFSNIPVSAVQEMTVLTNAFSAE